MYNINFVKTNVKLPVPYCPLELNYRNEEIYTLLSYIKDPSVQKFLTPEKQRGKEFYGSNYIRLVNGCMYSEGNNDKNWGKFFDWLEISEPTQEHINFYKNVRDLVVPLAAEMSASLSEHSKQKHYIHGVEINTVLPGTEIKGHIDEHLIVAQTQRVHLVLETNENSYMICNNEKRHFPTGSCFIFNNLMWHSVHNDGSSSRTHLVVDFLTMA
jgi:hypothetical protein